MVAKKVIKTLNTVDSLAQFRAAAAAADRVDGVIEVNGESLLRAAARASSTEQKSLSIAVTRSIPVRVKGMSVYQLAQRLADMAGKK